MTTIHLKRRYGKFFSNISSQDMVFALYEDVDGYIHYKHCDYDTETYQIKSSLFFEEFKSMDV